MLFSEPGIEIRTSGSGFGRRLIGSESARWSWFEGRVGQDLRIKLEAQTRWKTLETFLGDGEGEEGNEEESSVQRWWMSLKEKAVEVGEYVS